MFQTADAFGLRFVLTRQTGLLFRQRVVRSGKTGLVRRQRLVLDAQRLQHRKRLPRGHRLFGRQRVEVHLRKRCHGSPDSTVSRSRGPRSNG